jgi:hypothetical protein
MSNLDARSNLRMRQEQLQAAKDALKEAEKVAIRASEDLNKSADSLKGFDGLDTQFSKARIEALRKGEWKGYPPELSKKRIARLAAQEDFQHAQHAYSILKGQEDDARANVTIAAREVEEAAAAAFCEQIGDVVRQLNEANLHCESLRGVLRASCLPFGSPGWERLQPSQRDAIMLSAVRGAGLPVGTLGPWREIHVAASNAVHPPPSNGEVDADVRAFWFAFATALASDADAQPGPLPVSKK